MPSRAERRRAIERAWRALALLSLTWALIAAIRGPSRRDVQVTTPSALEVLVPELARAAMPARIVATLTRAPRPVERDALAAIAHAGGTVAWRADSSLLPLAVEVTPSVDPRGGAVVLIAAPQGSRAAIGDRAGPLVDPIAIGAAPAAQRFSPFVPPLDARVAFQVATASPSDSLVIRGVAVLGEAGWEGKFLLAALEEAGWHASASFEVAPRIAVTQRAPISLDTARTLAAIVLDSATAQSHARELIAFVRQGGGLILAGDAANAPALASIAPGRVGERVRPAALAFADSAPRRALGFRAITRLASDAIPLDSRDGAVAVAARRIGTGRIVQVGYDETWRWRFEGSALAPEAARDWWNGIVAGAAYRAEHALDAPANAASAPLARLVAALGPPSSGPGSTGDILPLGLPWWLLALILLSLLAEFASRRLRGAP